MLLNEFCAQSFVIIIKPLIEKKVVLQVFGLI